MKSSVFICLSGLPLPALFVSGCTLLFGAGVEQANREAQRRIDERPCRDFACDRSRWRLWVLDGDTLNLLWPEAEARALRVEWHGRAGGTLISASRNAVDGRIAFLSQSGEVLVADAPREAATVTAESAGLGLLCEGVAWSNGGEWLAAACLLDNGQHVLQVLNGSLEVEQERTIDLPSLGSRPARGRARYIVSWSTDDTWLVISPDELRGADTPGGVVLRLADGYSVAHDAFSMYFVSGAELVGKGDVTADSPVELFELDLSGVSAIRSIPDTTGVLAGDSLTGVFATFEESFRSVAIQPVGLRTAGEGADLLSGLNVVTGGRDSVLIESR